MPHDAVPSDLMALMGARRGHFVMESGHHGDLYLDLDGFFADPSTLEPFVGELARRVARFDPDLVCGPLTGGAFIAYGLACRLGTAFRWTQRENEPSRTGLFPYRYRLAGNAPLPGSRTVVVDDVINAGSATGETVRLLRECGATPVVLGALLTLGDRPARLAQDQGLELVTLTSIASNLWSPPECPLCSTGQSLEPAGA